MKSEDMSVSVGNQFKDTILSEIGEVVISNTQKYRVLIVLDNITSKRVISAQKWWRESTDVDWIAGKGFKLNKKKGADLASLILQACNEL